ncbi:MAG: cytochrome c [Pseudomonadales bacterium]|nr:cytochrome c [Pseudomonadales bacterium]
MPNRFVNVRTALGALALAAGISSFGGAGLALAADAPSVSAQQIEYRQAMYTVMAGNFAPLGAMATGKAPFNAKEAQKRAERVAYISNMLSEGFPPGSNQAKGTHTHAKPEIWSNRAEFDKLMKNLQTETAALVVATRTGDEAKFKPAAAATGKACKACHDKFKQED